MVEKNINKKKIYIKESTSISEYKVTKLAPTISDGVMMSWDKIITKSWKNDKND